MATLPTVLTIDGLQPQSPSSLNAQLIAEATALSPGLTANLPASLIEDFSSTGTGALTLIDQARVETVNSLTPYGANAYTLNQLGNQAGIPPNLTTNASVFMVFESNTPGWQIQEGWIVSDGTNQYVSQEIGVIPASGTSLPIYFVCTTPGTFPIPAGSVTNLITQPQSPVTATCTNPSAGVQGQPPELLAAYRTRVLNAGQSIGTGMTTTLTNALQAVPGVQPTLTGLVQQPGGGWAVICGGGDPYATAAAIASSMFDVSTLVGSKLAVSGITLANPGVVTTNLAHGLASGETITLTGIVGTTQLNNVLLTVTVLTPYTFSIGLNTSGDTAYVSGGTLNPNPRNQVITLSDPPNTYTVTYIVPPVQTVTCTVTWNTTAVNIVSNATIAQLMIPVVVAYINTLQVGAYINQAALQALIQVAIAPLIPVQLQSRYQFSFTINGVITSPGSGEDSIFGDPESGWTILSTGVAIVRG